MNFAMNCIAAGLVAAISAYLFGISVLGAVAVYAAVQMAIVFVAITFAAARERAARRPVSTGGAVAVTSAG